MGIDISDIVFTHEPPNSHEFPMEETPVQVSVGGRFKLDTDRFNLVTEELSLVLDAIDSDNPAVHDLLEQLRTTLRLVE